MENIDGMKKCHERKRSGYQFHEPVFFIFYFSNIYFELKNRSVVNDFARLWERGEFFDPGAQF